MVAPPSALLMNSSLIDSLTTTKVAHAPQNSRLLSALWMGRMWIVDCEIVDCGWKWRLWQLFHKNMHQARNSSGTQTESIGVAPIHQTAVNSNNKGKDNKWEESLDFFWSRISLKVFIFISPRDGGGGYVGQYKKSPRKQQVRCQ